MLLNNYDLHDLLFGIYGCTTVASTEVEIDGSRPRVTLNLKFYNRESLDSFMSDISRIEDERIAREGNPAVRRAYEEYQLLLKLSK